MAKIKKRNLFLGFGGVALADILANGVVVLLVVIIITISARKQQNEQEIEQSAEISAILARDIASSLVFNDLPSSPPAVLHNYNCIQSGGPWRNEYERHDCQPWLYPIIEFHNGYLREFNSRRIFTKEQLLEEDNEFDIYLRLLPQISRERIRADIYDLDLYYLAISIMKENNARPNHWHFLGEDIKPPESPGIAADNTQDEDDDFDSLELLNLNRSGSNDSGNRDETGLSQGQDKQQAEQEGQDPPQIPDDVVLREADRIEDLLPPGLGRGGEERGEYEEARRDIDSEFSGNSYSDQLGEALADALLEEKSGAGEEFGQPSSLRIRLPGTGEGEDGQEESLFTLPFDALQSGEFSPGGEIIDYHTLMIIMMMEYLKESGEVGFDRTSLQDLFMRIINGQIDIVNHPLLPFAEDLRDKMRNVFQQGVQSLPLTKIQCISCLGKLWINSNTPVDAVLLEGIETNDFRQEVELINIRFRLYPYPDDGEQTELFSGDTILIHPERISQGGKGWYPSVITDPNFSDLVVGYVYGETLTSDFYVEGDVNSVRLDSIPLISNLPIFHLRREIILGILYGLLSLSILTVFFYLIGNFRGRSYG